MINRKLVDAFKNMKPEDLKVFVEAIEQPSFTRDSPVRLLLKKYTQLVDPNEHYPIPFALSEMYIALSYALYEKAQEHND